MANFGDFEPVVDDEPPHRPAVFLDPTGPYLDEDQPTPEQLARVSARIDDLRASAASGNTYAQAAATAIQRITERWTAFYERSLS